MPTATKTSAASGLAYDGAMASGLGVQAAKRAAAKARRETT